MDRIVGKCRIPGIRLGILLDHLIALYKVYPNDEFTRNQFRDALNLKPGSSGIADKVKDMLAFGLLEKDEKELKYYLSVPLGKNVVNSTDTERPLIIERIVAHIPLWDQFIALFNKDTNIGDLKFISALKEVAGVVDLPEKRMAHIKWAYIEDVKCINKRPPYSKFSKNIGKIHIYPKSREIQIALPAIKEQSTKPATITNIPHKGYKVSSEYGEFQIWVRDEPSYLVALQMLTAIKKDLESNGVKFTKEVPQMGF